MNWLTELVSHHPVAHAVLVLSAVAALGLALGSLKIRGIGLGVTGVLFAGIAFGHFGMGIDSTILGYTRELGLVLFVYTIGMQVGPGFFSSLRKQGLPLNLMAAAIVIGGAALTLLIAYATRSPLAAMVGIFSGATTNTPSLGAAQEALKSVPGVTAEMLALPALGYAVAYPFGIVGIIVTMLAFRWWFRVDPRREAEAFHAAQQSAIKPIERMTLEVTNENLSGLTIREIPGIEELRVIISRIRPHGSEIVEAARADTVLHRGDVLQAVGNERSLSQLRVIIGKESTADLMQERSRLGYAKIVVTHGEVLGKSLRELALDQHYGVTVTRIRRGDVQLTAGPESRLQFGDRLRVVGEPEALTRVAEVLGNSVKALGHTNFISVFLGIALGILAGTYPIQIGAMPAPIALGMAGGPLLVAILLSRIGRIGPVVWYMPANANIALREFGIVLFLACVGLKAGGHFVHTLVEGDGLQWMAYGAAITLLPLLVVGLIARLFCKLNFMDLCGLLAGSMTDPPALAFANTTSGSDAPSIAYATVYPLTMLLRIVLAQVLVLFFL